MGSSPYLWRFAGPRGGAGGEKTVRDARGPGKT